MYNARLLIFATNSYSQFASLKLEYTTNFQLQMWTRSGDSWNRLLDTAKKTYQVIKTSVKLLNFVNFFSELCHIFLWVTWHLTVIERSPHGDTEINAALMYWSVLTEGPRVRKIHNIKSSKKKYLINALYLLPDAAVVDLSTLESCSTTFFALRFGSLIQTRQCIHRSLARPALFEVGFLANEEQHVQTGNEHMNDIFA